VLASDALIELAHGCRVGVGVAFTGPGSGQFPWRPAVARSTATRAMPANGAERATSSLR